MMCTQLLDLMPEVSQFRNSDAPRPTCHQRAGHVAAPGRLLRPALDAAVREEAAALQRVQRRQDDRKDLRQMDGARGSQQCDGRCRWRKAMCAASEAAVSASV